MHPVYGGADGALERRVTRAVLQVREMAPRHLDI